MDATIELLVMLGWLLFGACVWGVIGAVVAERFRGQGTAGFLWCFFIGPIGFIPIILMDDERRRCRHCGGILKGEPASRCRLCGGELPMPRQPAKSRSSKSSSRVEAWPPQDNGWLDEPLAPPVQELPRSEPRLRAEGEVSEDDVLDWLGPAPKAPTPPPPPR